MPATTIAQRSAAATRPATGFALGTTIMTLRGAVAVEDLAVGDRVITRQGVRAIRAIAAERLSAVRPCRITRDALGNARPDAEITVAPDQPILLRDWRAKALFDQGTAMVPAARLVDGTYIARARTPTHLDVVRLDLGGDHVVYANGLEFGVTAP